MNQLKDTFLEDLILKYLINYSFTPHSLQYDYILQIPDDIRITLDLNKIEFYCFIEEFFLLDKIEHIWEMKLISKTVEYGGYMWEKIHRAYPDDELVTTPID